MTYPNNNYFYINKIIISFFRYFDFFLYFVIFWNFVIFCKNFVFFFSKTEKKFSKIEFMVTNRFFEILKNSAFFLVLFFKIVPFFQCLFFGFSLENVGSFLKSSQKFTQQSQRVKKVNQFGRFFSKSFPDFCKMHISKMCIFENFTSNFFFFHQNSSLFSFLLTKSKISHTFFKPHVT